MGKVTYPKLRFSKLKKFISRSVFRELQLMQMSLNFQTSCCNSKIRGLGAKLCEAFLLFLFWKELWCFKEPMLFVEEKLITLIKTRQNRKWEIPYTLLERWTLCFSSHKNRELYIIYIIYICVLSQCFID